MNNTRREAIEALANKLEDLKSDLETIRDEEQEYFDNMPESLQGGEKGETSQSCCDSLDEAVSSLDDAVSSIGECY